MGSAAKFVDSLLFDMQHDHFSEIVDIRPIDPIPKGQGGRGSAAKVCEFLLFDM